jgi:hypothetical protein
MNLPGEISPHINQWRDLTSPHQEPWKNGLPIPAQSPRRNTDKAGMAVSIAIDTGTEMSAPMPATGQASPWWRWMSSRPTETHRRAKAAETLPTRSRSCRERHVPGTPLASDKPLIAACREELEEAHLPLQGQGVRAEWADQVRARPGGPTTLLGFANIYAEVAGRSGRIGTVWPRRRFISPRPKTGSGAWPSSRPAYARRSATQHGRSSRHDDGANTAVGLRCRGREELDEWLRKDLNSADAWQESRLFPTVSHPLQGQGLTVTKHRRAVATATRR